MQAGNDVGLCATIFPALLKLFCFNVCEIDFDVCLMQMFFINVYILMESGILFMTFDHYVAFSNLLRYATAFTDFTIANIGVGPLLWAMADIKDPFSLIGKVFGKLVCSFTHIVNTHS